MDTAHTLIDALSSIPATVREVDYRTKGYHLEVELLVGQLTDCAVLLREQGFYLVFVSALHLAPAITVVYQFASFQKPCRIMVRVPVNEDGSVPSLSSIFDGANWHERETRDMYGVVFSGHPYLEPLLLAEEDADLKPLLKGAGGLKTAEDIGWTGITAREQDVKP
jgi:NADH-quinone oxidoreductase subunit C